MLVKKGLSRDMLQQLRTREVFYCPVCHSPVTLKLGFRKKWHFSHKSRHSCLVDMEAESEKHLAGKKHLYNWVLGSEADAELEGYFPSLKQRPDIFIHGIEPMVIEFQCSTIPEQLIDARTAGYLRAGIDPVWILGGDRHKRMSGYLRLTDFEQHTIRRSSHRNSASENFSSPYYVCFFHPSEKQLIFESHLFPVSKTRFIAGEMKAGIGDFRLHQLTFPLCSFSQNHFKALLLQEKKKIRLRPPGRISAEEQWLRKQAYLHHHFFSYLPAFAGLPHESYIHLAASPFLWQYWIYLLMCGDRSPAWFTPEQIVKKTRESGGDLMLVRRKMPLCPDFTLSRLFRTYLGQLAALGIAEQREDAFCLNSKAVRPGWSLQGLMDEDRAILDRLGGYRNRD
jgi:Competence protein